jgi:hypothetical protein
MLLAAANRQATTPIGCELSRLQPTLPGPTAARLDPAQAELALKLSARLLRPDAIAEHICREAVLAHELHDDVDVI